MKKIFYIIILLAAIVCISGCTGGPASDDPIIGEYKAASIDSEIEIKDDFTFEWEIGDEKYEGVWGRADTAN